MKWGELLSGAALCSSICLVGAAGLVQATGIEQAYQSPRGAALGNAVIASVDDASAIHHNVAGLSQIERAQIQLNTLALKGHTRYMVAAGSGTADDSVAIAGSFFAAMPVAEGLGVGFGVTTPHGLQVGWDESHALRTLGYQGSLSHVRTSAGFGWQLCDGLEIGASAVYARDDIGISQGLVVPGDRFNYSGTGGSWGWTAGARWEFAPGHRIAVTYRSAIDVETEGDVKVTSLIPAIPSGKSSASLVFPYPQQLIIGYAWEANDRWLFEFNWQYTDWSTVDNLVIAQPAPLPDIVQPQGWKDSQFYSLGVTYRWNENIELRAGYLHGTNAVPDRSYGPLIPGSPYHALSLGVGVELENWDLDAAVILSWREDRTVKGSSPSPLSPVPVTADGEWNSDALGLFLGATRKF